VNPTPLEVYVGLPDEVNESEAPCVKSMVTALPRAESAGHAPLVRGLQLLYVCALAGHDMEVRREEMNKDLKDLRNLMIGLDV
jgi:hypothetical protein